MKTPARLPGAPPFVSAGDCTLVIYSNRTTHPLSLLLSGYDILTMHLLPYSSPSIIIIIVCDRCSHEGASIMQASNL